MDAPPRDYECGHQTVVGGQVGTPPVTSHVCHASFHDPRVAEEPRPGEERGYICHCTSGHPWGLPKFEPLIVAIIFPLSHVSAYTGPLAVKGPDLGEYYQHAL